MVILWVCQIDFFVRRIEITANNQAFALFLQLLGIFEKGLVEFHFVRKTLGACFSVGEIDVGQKKIAVICNDCAALAVKFLDAETIQDFLWFLARVNRNSAVAFLFRMAEVRGITLSLHQLFRQLIGTDFGFLQADNVIFFLLLPLEKAFFGDCSQAVYVPGCNSEFHRIYRLPTILY